MELVGALPVFGVVLVGVSRVKFWQDFFGVEGGGCWGGVAVANVRGSVLAQRFVGSGVVVIVAVGVHLLDEVEGVADFFPLQPFVFHGPEQAFV